MSISPAALIAQLRARREAACPLPGTAASVTVRRPPEADMGGLRNATPLDIAVRYVVAWQGMTRDILLGDGNTDPVEWSAELWAEVAADHADWATAITVRVGELITAHLQDKAAAAGN